MDSKGMKLIKVHRNTIGRVRQLLTLKTKGCTKKEM